MKVRKLGGKEEDFSLDKIINAVKKANNSVEKEKRMDDEKINQVVEFVQKKIKNYSTIDVDTIHDFVEKALMNKNQYDIAKSYVLYRSEKKKSKKYSDDELNDLIVNKANLWLDRGTMFGVEGLGFQRINIACPWSLLETALINIQKVIK